MKQYLEIGQIVSTHGIHGEMRVMPWCDDSETFCAVKKLYFDEGKTGISFEAKPFKNIVLLKIKDVDTVEQARTFRNRVLYCDRAEINLPEHTYFVQDLIGMQVTDADTGKSYGKITDVLKTGANDVYEVTDNQKKRYVPAIPDVVFHTDVENSQIKIRPLKGLFDDED